MSPSTTHLPSIQLEDVESGTGQLRAGALAVSHPAGQNVFSPGDVVFGKLRPYLSKSWLVSTKCHGSGEFMCLRPNADQDARFLLYVTLSRPWLEHATLGSYGAKMPRTSWEQMAGFPIPLHAIDEQRRIADFLDDRVARIDKIIAARRGQVALAEESYKAMLTSWFAASTTTTSLRHLVSDAAVGIVIQPSRLYTEESDGVPTLRGLNISEDGLKALDSDLVRITPRAHLANPRSQLRSGDVLVVRTGDAGTAAVVPQYAIGWNCIDLVIARPAQHVYPGYLATAINAAKHATAIAADSSGSIQQHFGVNALLRLRVPSADLQAQQATVATFATARERTRTAVAALERSIGLLTEYKQSLITAAVTGEFDVTTASRALPA